ncbi:50S ribosomal protein L6 [Aerococcaceae bacterium NML191292]|nr:50S ribosomal protein L6 [Aerococcaceae bacterium NML210727]MCW6654434.1 50S ribosomal protein L6 [Aerococcaceae bacterium NML201296]MCW6659063.1 50S ribosomal protein L6 [Aerococcaceae bacterium NML191292]MCW6660823.1 50S ribosomal protein L6 [Aerococcaceae bacterium NML201209]MCW6662396.1 50S ribosomal protein L6 [Aerococcaceae bacterium NML190073]MCW6664386.1 50S ribosomal protein L6 [Aerococcaceae bacterium NML191219]MCW6667156.1 50S ribosomal protein L6 [Aerococcaceae bacterium NML190
MSRIGKKPVAIPAGVTVEANGHTVTVKGPKGTLTRELHPNISFEISENEVVFTRPDDNKLNRSLHGTMRSVFNNMVQGVSEGFKKELDLIGVGYRAQKQGNKLVLSVGLSHPVEFEPQEGADFEVPSNTKIIVFGYDKEKVGALAANIRGVRPPEPYKGKGIRYTDEYVRRKEGKTGK